MEIINKEFVLKNEDLIIKSIKLGAIFIYPTDTIYGLGCNATSDNAVSSIRKAKIRYTKPFSVIAPSKEWIIKNCTIPKKSVLDKLPGPYTLILTLKKTDSISKFTNPGINTIGVRIPNNWFFSIIAKSNIPFITTSVNVSGEKHMERIEDLKPDIAEIVDYVIYDNAIVGNPSIKIDLTSL